MPFIVIDRVDRESLDLLSTLIPTYTRAAPLFSRREGALVFLELELQGASSKYAIWANYPIYRVI